MAKKIMSNEKFEDLKQEFETEFEEFEEKHSDLRTYCAIGLLQGWMGEMKDTALTGPQIAELLKLI